MAWEDAEVQLHTLQTMTEQSPLCEWVQPCKTASLFGNNVWIMGCASLPNLSTYSLAVIRPLRVTMGQAEYQGIATQTITESPLCFTFGSRHSGLGVFQTKTFPDTKQRVKADSSNYISCLISRFCGHGTIVHVCEYYFK
jgi:hypothetical protein